MRKFFKKCILLCFCCLFVYEFSGITRFENIICQEKCIFLFLNPVSYFIVSFCFFAVVRFLVIKHVEFFK